MLINVIWHLETLYVISLTKMEKNKFERKQVPKKYNRFSVLVPKTEFPVFD